MLGEWDREWEIGREREREGNKMIWRLKRERYKVRGEKEREIRS